MYKQFCLITAKNLLQNLQFVGMCLFFHCLKQISVVMLPVCKNADKVFNNEDIWRLAMPQCFSLRDGILVLPRFTVETSLDLVDRLKEMGMALPFASGDFSSNL